MAVLFVRISTMPILVNLLKGGVAAVLNTQYNIAEENTFSIANASGFKGEFLDEIGYQVSEDGAVWSNEAFISVKEFVETNTSQSSNQIFAANENTTYNLQTQALFPVNNSTDRIKIKSITGNGIPKFNGNPLTINQEIYLHQFSLITFETKDGGALPYATIVYNCGNHLSYNTGTDYSVTINVSTLGEITFVTNTIFNDTVVISAVTYDRVTDIDLYEITRGIINTQAKVNVVINSPMFSDSANNSIIIKHGNVDIVKVANENFDIFVNIGSNGKANIEIQHIFVDVLGTTTSSVVTLTVLEINASNTFVSGTNTVISTAC